MLRGRHDRVEQQLAIVIAQITLTDHGVAVEQVVTIEPGVYFIESLLRGLKASPAGGHVDWDRIAGLMKYGGIRIEDDVLVTAGEPENLTRPVLGD